MKWRLLFSAALLVALTLAPTPFIPQPYRVLARPRDIIPARVDGVPIDFYGYFYLAACETGFPLGIMRDLIGNAENMNWNPTAVSPARPDGHHDLGLCQHNSKFITYFAERYNSGIPYDPMNPSEAIPITARILADNLAQLGDMQLAVSAYKQGVGGVRKDGPIEWYVNKVMGGTT